MRNEMWAGAGRWVVLALALSVGACSEAPEMSPEQQAVFAQPVDAELVVPAARNAMRYQVGTITAPAGATVRIVMDNSATTSPAMIHNVVVVARPSDVDRVGRAAASERDNIPDDPAILTYTPLAGPGERTAVVFTMPPAGTYPFLCTYPGHFAFMQGTLVAE
ncbi:plastocyanin/azurin family copper-binding protein [Rubrivirga sp. IMCC45206]|uniref:plastocyanin/azurin family copper-binding protein n=1 Tax=Rubrivirga sp. IMCC45206 TaxID=3391614 RepID=UPI00399011C3